MPLSDSSNQERMKKSKRQRPQGAVGYRWSDTQKLECVQTFLMLGGNTSQTSMVLKIPVDTIMNWKKTEWWNNLVGDIRKEENLALTNKLRKVINSSWDAVGDRLEKGDYFYDQKTGKVKRKPVSMRDAALVANNATLLKQKFETAENFVVATEGIEAKLAKLAESFTKLTQGRLVTGPVEDIVPIAKEEEEDAVYEEGWDEGLQEGEPSVQLTPGTEESTERTDHSSE